MCDNSVQSMYILYMSCDVHRCIHGFSDRCTMLSVSVNYMQLRLARSLMTLNDMACYSIDWHIGNG